MKKNLKIIIIIFLLVFISLKINKLCIKKYTISYKINNYQIKEIYKFNKHTYNIIIKSKNNTYIYTINHNLHKNKKIIKSIKTYKKNNLTCIIPIYKKYSKKNMYCNLDNHQVSNDYLIKSNNKDLKIIRKKIKAYNVSFPNNSDIAKKYKKIKVYQENILEDDIHYYWDYKGIYILDKNKLIYQKILNNDLYDNIIATAIKNYYILLENTSVNGIKNIYYYDFKNSKLKTYSLKKALSKDVYINGTMNNIVYLTDKKEKKQYKLNIKKEMLERIDQDETIYITYNNGKIENLSKSDFFMTEQHFTNNKVAAKKISNSEDIRVSGNYYYFMENNKLYKVSKYDKKHKILLLELNNIKEWNIEEDKIIILQDDTIYNYQDEVGLRKILESNELKYNYKNIYKIGKK